MIDRNILLGFAFGLGLVSAFEAKAASIDQTCKDAEREHGLTWYSANDPALTDATLKAFKATYPGINAEFFRLASGALATRYASERESSVINADVVSIVDPVFVKAGQDKGWFEGFQKADLPALAGLNDRFFDKGASLTAIVPYGISYNTTMVGNDPPTDWKDLLRPAYKGHVALGDPRNVPGFLDVFRVLRQEYGDDFLKDLAKQDLVVVSSVVPGVQQMAAGEFTILFPNGKSTTEPAKLKGAPVDLVIPKITTGGEYKTVISKGTDSPNAAKCFYNFLFTEAGQKAFNSNIGVSPILNPDSLPQGYQPLDAAAALAMRDEIIQLLGLR